MQKVDAEFRFRPSARLQRFLGRELIADPNVAIIEFVKNSYDAGAAHVLIEFSLGRTPTTLTIADDGVGMSTKQFAENWMRPGFSQKVKQTSPRNVPAHAMPAQARAARRVPVGEKGIGRLAAGRLGEVLDVYTRRATNQPWLHVHFRWSDFDDMNMALDEVPIAHDYETAPVDPPYSSGTIVVISELSQKWEERIRGRPMRGRRRTRLGRLKQDFEFLVRPMGVQRQQDFVIELRSDMIREEYDVGQITPAIAASESAYGYSFRFTEHKGETIVHRAITRSADAAREARKLESEDLGDTAVDNSEAGDEGEERPAELLCGEFEGLFLYDPPPAQKRAREIDKSPVGVLLYRDGLLVEPYGIGEDDWLGARARKAQRQGYAAIQPDTLSGHVLITRGRNPALRDQSNRLGLLDTPEAENFLKHLRAEFRVFEKLVTEEVLEQRWEGRKEDRAAREAGESQELARIQLRALAHSLRQSLQGVGFEVVTLETLRRRPDLPPDVSLALGEVSERTGGHVKVAEELIEAYLESKRPEFAEISVKEVVRRAVEQTQPLVDGTGADVRVESVDTPVLVPTDLVVQALAGIIANAVEAPRSNGARVDVEVEATKRNGDVAIRVSDNATGIPGATSNTALAGIKSTKGRPAVGLSSSEMSVIAARGRLRLVSTGDEGTTFELLLPTRVAGLRE
jgi:signal transduction histidine kinase